MSKLLLPLILYLVVCCVPSAMAKDVGELQREGVQARRAGRFNEALSRLREAARLKPDDSDIQLQLGLTLTSLRKLSEAERALRLALKLSPKDLNAKLGLARLKFFHGQFNAAREAALEVVAARKEDKDAQELLTQIDRAISGRRKEQRAAQQRSTIGSHPISSAKRESTSPNKESDSTQHWKFDMDGSLSKLTGGRQDWREVNARLGYEASAGTVLSAAVQSANRFGISNTYSEIRIDQKNAQGLTGYVYGGLTPNAEYLPTWAAGTGGTARLYQQKGFLAATVLTFDARYASYMAGPVRTVSPGIQQYLLDGRVWLTGRWINVVDEGGKYRQGYFVRGDIMLRDDLRTFVGYSDAPETSLGITVPTRTLFGGVIYDVNKSLTLRLSTEYEQRPQFDRITYTLGMSYKF